MHPLFRNVSLTVESKCFLRTTLKDGNYPHPFNLIAKRFPVEVNWLGGLKHQRLWVFEAKTNNPIVRRREHLALEGLRKVKVHKYSHPDWTLSYFCTVLPNLKVLQHVVKFGLTVDLDPMVNCEHRNGLSQDALKACNECAANNPSGWSAYCSRHAYLTQKLRWGKNV